MSGRLTWDEVRRLIAVPKGLEEVRRSLVRGTSADMSVGAVLEAKARWNNQAEAAPKTMTVKDAIKIILSDTNAYPKALNYAVGYCRVGLQMSEGYCADGSKEQEALRVQCLYILNNIQHWRHAQAKEVRACLKKFAGIK